MKKKFILNSAEHEVQMLISTKISRNFVVVFSGSDKPRMVISCL